MTAARRRLVAARERVRAVRWFDRGIMSAPAGVAKRRHLLRIFNERRHRVFIEAGTYRGDTVAFFVPHASRIVSVEIDPQLHAEAERRFAEHDHVEIVLGDAAECIPRIVASAGESCLVWLDGHYSGPGTGRGREVDPAIKILTALRGAAPPITIVVDDLRLFGSDPHYPRLDELVDAATTTFPEADVSAELDALVVRV